MIARLQLAGVCRFMVFRGDSYFLHDTQTIEFYEAVTVCRRFCTTTDDATPFCNRFERLFRAPARNANLCTSFRSESWYPPLLLTRKLPEMYPSNFKKRYRVFLNIIIRVLILFYSFSEFINCTLPYELPMKVHNVYEVTEMRTYALFCVYLIPVSMMLTIGATGADSLLVTLTFHICSQLSILTHRIKNVEHEPQIYFPKMRILVERHIELLK